VKDRKKRKQNLIEKAEKGKTVLLYMATGLFLGKYKGDLKVLFDTMSQNKVQNLC
jgi:hypothetical protein